MSWNNKHTPTVRIQAQNNASDKMIELARSLKQSGNDDLAKLILQDKVRLENNIPAAIKKLGNNEVKDAKDLVRDRQYKSKSGYVGHGNLMNSIKAEISDDKLSVDIAPHAESKEGYEYGQAFEFGLKKKDYPAQHPMHDSGIALDVDKLAKEAIDKSIK